MDVYLMALLQVQALSAMRHDDTVARQHVMNHGTASHLMDLAFVRDSTEMSIPESIAVQGMNASQLPLNAAGLNTANQTPNKGV